MHAWRCAIISFGLVILLSTSGCLDRFYEKPVTLPVTTIPVVTVPTENFTATVSPSEMALQLSDLPGDYFLRDRTVAAYDEQLQINRDLGWMQGYRVSFYRMELDNDDLTGIMQTLDVYPLENMNKLYSIEKDALLQTESPFEKYEIPFPVVGDMSIAVRKTDPNDRYKVVTYTVLFANRNVLETITMTGTTTDYEVLKTVVKKASARVR